MALMCVTSTAKVEISLIVATLAENPTFVSGLFAWTIAQSMKVFLNFCKKSKWDFRIIFATGGMPSSHPASCTALTVYICGYYSWSGGLIVSDLFEVLNLIVEDLFQGHPMSQRKLKELLGHTPSQVLAGALLGIVVAWICCQGCLIAS